MYANVCCRPHSEGCVSDATVDLPDTMVDLPDTMVDLLDTVVDIPDTMIDLPGTMILGCWFFFIFSVFFLGWIWRKT
jgi:hypothetical protein